MFLVDRAYRKIIVHRYDDDGYIHYFNHKDFEGLTAKPFTVISDGNRLNGSFYSYENLDNTDLVVFCHGIGGGHLSYMTEINKLCENGFTVLAFDYTGCHFSEGKDIMAFSHSINDLNCVIEELKKEHAFESFRNVYVMGHSWGGYTAGNICQYQSIIKKSVVISGFVSVPIIIKNSLDSFPGFLRGYIYSQIIGFEKRYNPVYYLSSSLDSYRIPDSKFLIIHSEDDPVVQFEPNVKYVQDNYSGPNVQYLIVNGKKHNPHYTQDASDYMNEVFSDFNSQVANKKLKTVEEKRAYLSNADWKRMTKQDDAVWSVIFDFLKN